MEERYGRKSTIITTNLDYPDCDDLFRRKTFVNALLDRLKHHCITIRIPGIGMASVERNHTIAPAILELAETRAIERSLRVAGYNVESCSAEEVSHLVNGNGGGNFAQEGKGPSELLKEDPKGGEGEKPRDGDTVS